MSPETVEQIPELLPCPFCGGEASIERIRDGRQVLCKTRTCWARGPAEFNGPATMPSAAERAATGWNRRPSSEAGKALTFDALRVANAAREGEWEQGTDGGFSMLFLSNAMCGEAGEAANVVKKLERERIGAKGSRASIDDLGSELADIIIYADLLARKVGVDLGAHVAAKFNSTSEKHGFQTRIRTALQPGHKP